VTEPLCSRSVASESLISSVPVLKSRGFTIRQLTQAPGARHRTGSTAYHVVLEAHAPVLSVRRSEEQVLD
jgi:hypothetical protein